MDCSYGSLYSHPHRVCVVPWHALGHLSEPGVPDLDCSLQVSPSLRKQTAAPPSDISAVGLILDRIDRLCALKPRAPAVGPWELPRAPVLQPLQEVPPRSILLSIACHNGCLHRMRPALLSNVS